LRPASSVVVGVIFTSKDITLTAQIKDQPWSA
jgi:hypothetical protein